MDHDTLGEGRAVQALRHLAAIGSRQDRLDFRRRRAAGRVAARTGGAASAGPDQGDQDRIARYRGLHARADRGNPARGLMPVDRRQRTTPAALDIGDVGMTDGAGFQRDLDLARGRRAQVQGLDRKGLAECMADRGADFGHLSPSPARAPPTSGLTDGAASSNMQPIISTPDSRNGAPGR